MDLYTSHYSCKLIDTSKMAPVRTSIGAPRWPLSYVLHGECKLLMPRRPMLKMEIEEYRPAYIALLEGHGVEKIQADLERLAQTAGGRPLVFLCFEDLAKKDNWCHRRMFADWWEAATGQEVPELAAEFRESEQSTLFDC
jgi:hypothetical protein